LPLNISLRLIDIFLTDGWKALMRAGLALLCAARNEILQSGFDKILLLLKRKDLTSYLQITATEFIELAMSFKITNSKLHENAIILLHQSMKRTRENNNI